MDGALKQYLQEVLSRYFNENVIVHFHKQVYGGDINQTFILQCNKQSFFLKLNDSSKQDMFEKEFNGLKLLASAKAIHVPQPYLHGHFNNTIYLLMEHLKAGEAGSDFWKDFGYQLAALHKTSNTHFGLEEDNYIGSLPQQNNYGNNWAEFYTTQHILPLIQMALKQGKCSESDVALAENVCNRFKDIFPTEPPALLHGDLWGGNYMVTANGKAAIYDPAVYYGHREMDIAMTKLFGGFDNALYHYYNEAYPLEKGWQQRMDLCQLYPLLVHLILFGGHYYDNVKDILSAYQ